MMTVLGTLYYFHSHEFHFNIVKDLSIYFLDLFRLWVRGVQEGRKFVGADSTMNKSHQDDKYKIWKTICSSVGPIETLIYISVKHFDTGLTCIYNLFVRSGSRPNIKHVASTPMDYTLWSYLELIVYNNNQAFLNKFKKHFLEETAEVMKNLCLIAATQSTHFLNKTVNYSITDFLILNEASWDTLY